MTGDAPLRHAVFSADGERVLVQSETSVSVWDYAAGEAVDSLPLPLTEANDGKNVVTPLEYRQDGSLIVGASANELLLWDAGLRAIAKRELVGSSPGFMLPFLSASYGRGSASIVTTVSRAAIVWDAETGAELIRVEHGAWICPRLWCQSASYSPDGLRIAGAVGDEEGENVSIRVFDAITHRQQTRIAARPAWLNGPSFSPDGHSIAGSSTDKEPFVGVWDANTGELQRRISLDTGLHLGLHLAIFSPRGQTLAIGLGGPYLGLHDTKSGDELRRLEHRQSNESIECAAFSPDGTLVITSCGDDTLVWDVESGKVVERIDNIKLPRSLAFSPDGSRVASGGLGVRVWDATDGYVVFEDRDSTWIGGFSPSGELVGLGTRQQARIWDDAGNVIRRMWHDKVVKTAVFSPDGRDVLTASSTGIRVWEAAPWRRIDPFQFCPSLPVMPLSPQDRQRAGLSIEPSPEVWTDAGSPPR